MQPMTPVRFYQGFVQEDFEEFRMNPGSVRTGIHAAVSAFHLADHYYEYSKRHAPSKVAAFPQLNFFVEDLIARYPEFGVMENVANAYKHLYRHKKKPYIDIRSGGAIFQLRACELEFESEYANSEAVVVFRTHHGKTKLLMTPLSAVQEMWAKILELS